MRGFDREPAQSAARRALIRIGLDVRRYEPMRAVSLCRSGLINGGSISFEPSSEAFARLRQASAGDELWDCFEVGLRAATRP